MKRDKRTKQGRKIGVSRYQSQNFIHKIQTSNRTIFRPMPNIFTLLHQHRYPIYIYLSKLDQLHTKAGVEYIIKSIGPFNSPYPSYSKRPDGTLLRLSLINRNLMVFPAKNSNLSCMVAPPFI